jgi:hypothetical protein
MAKTKVGSLFKPKEEQPSPRPTAEPKQPKRGKHLISGLFEEPTYRQFTMLAAEFHSRFRRSYGQGLFTLNQLHQLPHLLVGYHPSLLLSARMVNILYKNREFYLSSAAAGKFNCRSSKKIDFGHERPFLN